MTLQVRLAHRRGDFALDLDLSLPATGVTAVFGPSGCGKTTLLRAIAGLDRATGRVALGNAVWQDDEHGVFVPPHRRGIGYVIQEAALFPHLSVERNLDYGRLRAPAPMPAAALADVVELLGIGALMARAPATLSGGERQRVAIARALASGARLLLMDEPLAALDAARKAEILPYLERLHRAQSLAIVYVSHAMDEVARLADHLVLMAQGRAVAVGALGEVLARPDVAAALALPGRDDAGAVLDGVVAEHDERWHLSRVDTAGVSWWLPRVAPPAGDAVRLRIRARDVSLAAEAPRASSILNVHAATVRALTPQDGGSVLVSLEIDGAARPLALLSRVTARSVDALALVPGARAWAQVKGVSLG